VPRASRRWREQRRGVSSTPRVTGHAAAGKRRSILGVTHGPERALSGSLEPRRASSEFLSGARQQAQTRSREGHSRGSARSGRSPSRKRSTLRMASVRPGASSTAFSMSAKTRLGFVQQRALVTGPWIFPMCRRRCALTSPRPHDLVGGAFR
jgi:hypothetical protein